MASSISKRATDTLQLLKQYKAHDIRDEDFNELMMVPKKKTLFSVLFYIMDLVNKNWRHECSPVLLSKRDESQFLTLACKHIRQLGKDFPEVALPPITPSSLASLHGEKFGKFFHKLTCAIMVKILEKEDLSTEEEFLTEDILELQRKIPQLEKVIEEKRAVKQSIMKKEKEILERIISAGDWNEPVKQQLLDLKNDKVIDECIEGLQKCEEERSKLNREISPYLYHISNCNKNQCPCDSKYILNEEKSNSVRTALIQRSQEKIQIEIRDLKSRAAVRELLQGDANESNFQKLITKLESLQDLSRSSPLKHVQVPFQESPAVENETLVSPCSDSTFEYFSPVLVEMNRVLPKYEERVKVDVASLPLLWHQRGVMVSTSPGILPPWRGARCTMEEPAQPKDLFSIVQRLQAASGCKPRRSRSFHFEPIPENSMASFPLGKKYGSQVMTPLKTRGSHEDVLSSRRHLSLSTKPRGTPSHRRLNEDSPFRAPTATPLKRSGTTPSNMPFKAHESRAFKASGETVFPTKNEPLDAEEVLDLLVHKMIADTDLNETFSDGEWTPDRLVSSTQIGCADQVPKRQYLGNCKQNAATMGFCREQATKEDRRSDLLNKSPTSSSFFLHFDSSSCRNTIKGNEREEGEEEEADVLAMPLDIHDIEEPEPETPGLSNSLQDIINRYRAIKFRKQE